MKSITKYIGDRPMLAAGTAVCLCLVLMPVVLAKCARDWARNARTGSIQS